jgi:pimeloyl-ACP methyl ester carboxylesterase
LVSARRKNMGDGNSEFKHQPLQNWIGQGRIFTHEGNRYFVHASGKAAREGDGVLIVHGFPGSSWDWSGVVPSLARQTHVVVPDMLGYGQSDKPAAGNYSIFKSADMYEAVAKDQGLRDVVLAIHDLGQTVGSELMARQEEGTLSFHIRHAVVFNGSTLVDMVHLVDVQKQLLDMPDEPLAEDLPPSTFRDSLPPTMSKEHQPSRETIDAMDAQIRAKHGDRLMPRLIRYLPERQKNLDRWRDGLTKFSGAENLYWGTQDPVALVVMADKIKELNPAVDLQKWPDVGHWPSIEVPERVSKAIAAAM